ncbi:unnamed protein product [Discula destructiva]
MTTLDDLIGIYDNSHEAPGLLNHPPNILAFTISFMIFAWICAIFRLYTRFFIIRSPGWDDFFVILSLLSTAAGNVTICLAVKYGGMGRHFITLGEDTMRNYLKSRSYVANATYPASAGFIKLAILLQYLRVYEKKSRCYTATIITIVTVTLWSLIYAVLAWVPTLPVYAFWNLKMPATRYAFGSLEVEPFVSVYTSLTASNMALDIITLGLAAPLSFYRRDPNSKFRWTLMALFGIGTLASMFSVLRLASIMQSAATTYPTFDPTWYGPTPIVYAALEVDIATVTAALPVFWPVLRELHLSQILVTREIKVTLEHRRLSTGGTATDPDDDGIELQRSKSGLQVVRRTCSGYYGDPFVAQHVNPFQREEFGVKADVDSVPMRV